MKAARIALRTAAPLVGGSGGSGSGSFPTVLEQFARFSPSPLSIKQLLDFGERRDGQGWDGARVWPAGNGGSKASPAEGRTPGTEAGGGCRSQRTSTWGGPGSACAEGDAAPGPAPPRRGVRGEAGLGVVACAARGTHRGSWRARVGCECLGSSWR